MSTTGALNSALSGLGVANRQLDIHARNVSNASSPGYTRKVASQETVIANGQVIGVQTGEIQRFVDKGLQRDILSQQSRASYYQTLDSRYERIQQIHGPPESERNVAGGLAELRDSFNKLAATPESEVLHQEVISSAQNLATQFRSATADLLDLRNNVQTEIAFSVDQINTNLAQIAELNGSIQSLTRQGRSAADIADQRDVLVQEVAKKMDISTFERSDGVVTVQTREGRFLADTIVQPLSFTQSTLGVTSAYPATASGVIIGDPATGFDLASIAPGGELGALLELRDDLIPQHQAQLDELAHKTALRFQAEGLELFQDGAGTIPADAPPAYVGFANTMQVTAAVVATPANVRDGFLAAGPVPAVAPGSNEVALRVVNNVFGLTDSTGAAHTPFRNTGLGPDGTQTTGLATGATLERFARDSIISQAERHSGFVTNSTADTQFLETLENRFLNDSAVDVDQELADIIEIESAYRASAQVLQVVQELIRELQNVV